MAETPLSFRQRMFVSFYLANGGNASDAARKAGYGAAHERGCELLKLRKVRREIDAHLNDHALAAEETLARITEQATGSIDPFLKRDEAGKVIGVDMDKASKQGATRLVTKFKFVEKEGRGGTITRTWEVGIQPPLQALALLAKYRRLLDAPPAAATYATAPVDPDPDEADVEPAPAPTGEDIETGPDDAEGVTL